MVHVLERFFTPFYLFFRCEGSQRTRDHLDRSSGRGLQRWGSANLLGPLHIGLQMADGDAHHQHPNLNGARSCLGGDWQELPRSAACALGPRRSPWREVAPSRIVRPLSSGSRRCGSCRWRLLPCLALFLLLMHFDTRCALNSKGGL